MYVLTQIVLIHGRNTTENLNLTRVTESISRTASPPVNVPDASVIRHTVSIRDARPEPLHTDYEYSHVYISSARE